MKKIILSAALLLGSSIAIGMERSDKGWLWKKKKIDFVPEKIIQLRKEKTAFESELRLGRFYQFAFNLSAKISGETIHVFEGSPKGFLQYIYYRCPGDFPCDIDETYVESEDGNSDFINAALNDALKYNYNGYGVLGAVIITNREKKRELIIARLLPLGFLPTKKDLNLAYLDFWERTQKDSTRKALLCFGSKDKNSMLSWLSLDLIKLIAQFIEPAEKPLLPRKFFENGVIKMQSIEE